MISLSYLLKSTLVLGVGFAYYRLALRQETRFQFHRAYLLGVVLAGLLLPLTHVPASVVDTTVLTIPSVSLPEISIVADSAYTFSWLDLLLLVYLSGLCWKAGRWLFQMRQIYRLIATHHKQEQSGATFVYTPESIGISSFFRFIFWHEPKHLTADQRQLLLQHELCHVHQRHSWDIMMMEILLIIFWFQPFLYLLRRVIHQNHEFLADQAGMQHSTVRSYTQLILTQLFGQQLSLVHSFFHPPLTMRVTMLSKKQASRRANWKYLALLPLFTTLMIAISCMPDAQGSEAEVSQHVKVQTEEIVDIPPKEVDQYPKPLNMQEVQMAMGYPKEAHDQQLEGKVLIKVLVDKSGAYLRHEILQSPHELFTDAVEQHIKELKFEPAKLDDKPVQFWVSIPFNFKLK